MVIQHHPLSSVKKEPIPNPKLQCLLREMGFPLIKSRRSGIMDDSEAQHGEFERQLCLAEASA